MKFKIGDIVLVTHVTKEGLEEYEFEGYFKDWLKTSSLGVGRVDKITGKWYILSSILEEKENKSFIEEELVLIERKEEEK